MEKIWIVLLVLVGLVLFKLLFLPFLKGKLGESLVRLVLGRDKEGSKRIINDVMIVVDGKSSQIDHVVVNDRGVFCIETKNYSGRIYGEQSQQQWTQVLAYGKVKNHFYSPVKQNWTHVMRLTEVLDKDYPVYSTIVFTQGNVRFINAKNVVALRGLKANLNSQGQAGTLSAEQIEAVAQRIRALKDEPAMTAKEHVEEIRQRQTDIENHICPRCGRTLVLRNGKYGQFYGCSNYPNCKFTKRVE